MEDESPLMMSVFNLIIREAVVRHPSFGRYVPWIVLLACRMSYA